MTELKECKYKLPCGWCDRKNEKCELFQKPISEKQCDHDWYEESTWSNNQHIYCCRKCGKRIIY